jgi:hypothetical protein
MFALPAILGQDAEKRIIPIPPQGKIALVIGNGDYVSQSKIPQAVNDAVDMEKTLTGLGFRVILVKNAQIGELDRKLDEFYTAIRPGALAWFFYSGHGGSLGEENYLLPVEFRQQETESGVERNAVAVSKIRNRMEERGARVRLLVFDACRNAALLAAKDTAGGLVEQRGKAEGTLIAYASAHGAVSRYNPNARNSYYTAELLERLKSPKTDLSTLLNETADGVYQKTGESQMPYLYGRLFGKLYLGEIPRPVNVNVDADVYNAAKDSTNPTILEEAAGQIKDPQMAAALRLRAKVLRGKAEPASTIPRAGPSPSNSTPPRPEPQAQSSTSRHVTTVQIDAEVMVGKLVRRVEPMYSPIDVAAAGDQDAVKFTALIAKDGHVAQLTLISGSQFLAEKAKRAAQQWIYRPTVVNGEAVEVITTIIVKLEMNNRLRKKM